MGRFKKAPAKCLSTIVFSALLCMFFAVSSGLSEEKKKNSLPLISDMVTVKTEKKKVVKKKEIFPRALTAREANNDILELLPAGALYYFEIPNGKVFGSKYKNSSIAQLLEEKTVVAFMRKNSLSLSDLLVDLPKDFSSGKIVAMLNVFSSMLQEFIDVPGRVAVAGYGIGDEEVVFCFAADVGRNRRPPYEELKKIIAKGLEDSPELILRKADHKDDYIEKLFAGSGKDKVEFAYGFVKNFFIITGSPDFAQQMLKTAKKGIADAPLADDKACKYLNNRTDTKSLLRGYVSLSEIKNASKSKEDQYKTVIGLAEDLTNRFALYYDMNVIDEAVIEHITVPIPAASDTATLASRLNMISQKGRELNSSTIHSSRLMPIETAFFMALKVKPSDLTALLSEDKIFGSSDFSTEITGRRSKLLMDSLRAMADSADEIFDGELSLGVIGQGSTGMPEWLMSFPLLKNSGIPEFLKSFGLKPVKSNNVDIYTGSGEIDGQEPAWALFSHEDASFRKLGRSFLVCASTAKVMQDIIDRTIGGRATLNVNEDFKKQIDRVRGTRSMACYYNMGDTLRSGYPTNLREILRICYPKSQIHSLPSLTSLSRYIFGLSVSMTISEEYGLRFSFSSPMGIVPAVVVPSLLAAPVMLRAREESAITEERRKLSSLNLALQEYATLYGRFPSSLTRMRDREAIQKLLPENEELAGLLTSTAAGYRLGGNEEAAKHSWIYVSGLRPSDVPDNIILYSKKPYHYQYRTARKQFYEPFRMALTIDGNIKLYPEDEFVRKILPTVKNR
ncbi:MAG: hypothetical protein ACYTFY_03145 [Planctomycetota bacterium]|jgi:hypothetical protein